MLHGHIRKNNMKTFIQIGAGAGDQDPRAKFRDGFTEYVKSLDKSTIGRILLVEPNPINIPLLRECWKDYPQAEIFNVGICPSTALQRSITFYYTEEDGPHFQVFSMSKEHVRKHYLTEEIKETIVECITLKEFLDTNVGNSKIDILALDIEGIDAEVILETDWQNLQCARLSYEHLHLAGLGGSISEKLINAGYRFTGTGIDYNGYDHQYEKDC